MKDQDLLLALGSIARDEQRAERTTLTEEARARRRKAALQMWSDSSTDRVMPSSQTASRVVPFRARLRSFAYVAGPLAAAASLVLWLRVSRDELLAEYSCSVNSSVATARGASAEDPSRELVVSGVDVPFEVLLRPSKNVASVFATCVVVGLATPEPCRAEINISPQGAVRVRGQTADFRSAGELRIVLSSTLLDWNRASKLLASPEDGSAKVIRVQINH